ncbi:hypothetical protein [Alteraurantiacibacter aquimixticola]|uniref:Uncharacterized protein n=1 Tax=Alteraurantiacibacter aquimixticola TaxID=2489173 RepID=A0A4T3F4F6_9SPHN|nr:hypothetical protein [Alteraurantiacibacter aquimixticola]TIX50388.1 hypothetical protein E5222_08925 [Alteraurantiacibacter aquimixticola]
MPEVFEASAKSSVAMKVFHLLIAVLVTIAMGVGAWMIDSWFARIVLGLFILIGFGMSSSLLREVKAYAGATGSWRVEVGDSMLSWDSPVETLFASFRLPLADIAGVQSIRKALKNAHNGGSVTRYFYVHLKNGKTMELPAQEGGVWVLDVFKSLEKRGIPFRDNKMRNSDAIEVQQGFDILPMDSWPR